MLFVELIGAATVLSARPEHADLLVNRVTADVGPAVEAVERFWDRPWDRNVRIVTTDSESQFLAQARLDPTGQWNDIAAVAVADQVDLASGRVTGGRIVFAPGASEMSDEALRIVVTHELFHLAARGATATDAPRWLTEGVADYVARPPAPIPAGGPANTDLPADAELDRAGTARSDGYDRAWWFSRFVADVYGVDGLRRLYHRACGPGHGSFPDAVRQALGVDTAELRSQWAQWLSAGK